MYFKDKKVLVAGGTGLIGSNLITRLLAEGACIRATRHRQPPVVADERVEYLASDLTRDEDCRRAVEGMEFVFLCAANTSGAHAVVNTPLVHVTPNILINAQMLQAAYDSGVKKFLWISSSTVYPPSGSRPIREEELLDGDPAGVTYFSGWAKRFGEILCRMYGEKLAPGMTTVVIRPTNIYGVNDKFDFERSHFIPALIRKVVERWDPVVAWGTGGEVRDVIFVDDMVEAMLRALERVDGYDVFNIGSGTGVTIREILNLIIELDGYAGARVVFDPSKPTTFPIRLLDTSKAERVLGFKPRVALRDGLRRTIEWYRKVSNLPRPAAAVL